jgi:hypothetical protein
MLAAALMLGVIAMHSFGHQGHGENTGEEQSQVLIADHASHASHPGMIGTADDAGDPSPLLSLLGVMVCAAILVRLGFDWLRSAWSRIRDRLLAAVPALVRASRALRLWLPPPRLTPTSVQMNRIAVLRI